jgi:hypothetical protein
VEYDFLLFFSSAACRHDSDRRTADRERWTFKILPIRRLSFIQKLTDTQSKSSIVQYKPFKIAELGFFVGSTSWTEQLCHSQSFQIHLEEQY